MYLSDLMPLLADEMAHGYKRYGAYHNSHELYAVLKEEVDEFWDTVKGNTSESPEALYELLQVAAVALRYIIERGDAESIEAVQYERYKDKQPSLI